MDWADLILQEPLRIKDGFAIPSTGQRACLERGRRCGIPANLTNGNAAHEEPCIFEGVGRSANGAMLVGHARNLVRRSGNILGSRRASMRHRTIFRKKNTQDHVSNLLDHRPLVQRDYA